MTAAPPAQVRDGYQIYTPFVLSLYDLAVLGFLARFVWKCPVERHMENYERHVTGNHADVGVGTGYFLEHCRFPVERPRIALIDANANSLSSASRRLGGRCEVYNRNVLEEVKIDGEGFDSVGLSGLLHCLPGDMASKAKAFDCLRPIMNEKAVLFGCTLVFTGNRVADLVLGAMNARRLVHNRDDDPESLRRELSRRFEHCDVETVGSMALFWAHD